MHQCSRFFVLSALSLACVTSVFAAKPIDLKSQPVSSLQSFITPSISAAPSSSLKQIRSEVDFNQTTHLRVQQTFGGYPVWGGDAIVHVPHGVNVSLANLANSPKASMNGILYQDLKNDLANAPAYIFNANQADKALQHAIQNYQQSTGSKNAASETKSNLVVFVDKKNKAHWAYLTSFTVIPDHGIPAKPTSLIDALSFEVYQQWNNIQTLDDTAGGGFGGNEKMGELSYDGLPKDLASLKIQRDATSNTCYLQNADVTVKDARYNSAVVNYKCTAVDNQHNNTFWDGSFDAVNGAYSPANDALFIGKVVKDLYQNWYGLPVLVSNGKPMMLNMRVHIVNYDNAFWDGQQMNFGDGQTIFYPLVSFGVGAHEISHGFTEQHSGLAYYGQSGGLNESFSDMAAQAAEYYGYGHNSWQIGPEIFKQKDKALRYMDLPSKDCNGGQPGNSCSIDNMSEYNDNLDVHYSSGIFNRIFYLIGTAQNWDTHKAFDVMVQANMHYWTSTTSFADAACGVVKATKDYKYDMAGVMNAMKTVGIDVSKC